MSRDVGRIQKVGDMDSGAPSRAKMALCKLKKGTFLTKFTTKCGALVLCALPVPTSVLVRVPLSICATLAASWMFSVSLSSTVITLQRYLIAN